MNAASKVVKDGGLAEALCDDVLRETQLWPRFQDSDFEENLHLEVSNIDVKSEVQNKIRFTGEIRIVSFDYKGNRYKVILTDRGTVLNDGSTFGEVEFFANDERALWLTIGREKDTFWKSGVLKGFKTHDGKWMKDLILLSAEIKKKRKDEMLSDIVTSSVEAAKNIEM